MVSTSFLRRKSDSLTGEAPLRGLGNDPRQLQVQFYACICSRLISGDGPGAAPHSTPLHPSRIGHPRWSFDRPPSNDRGAILRLLERTRHPDLQKLHEHRLSLRSCSIWRNKVRQGNWPSWDDRWNLESSCVRDPPGRSSQPIRGDSE